MKALFDIWKELPGMLKALAALLVSIAGIVALWFFVVPVLIPILGFI